MVLGESRTLEGRWLASAAARDPLPAFAVAEANARRALALSGGKSRRRAAHPGRAHRWRAEWRAAASAGVAATCARGLALAARALEQKPDLALAAAAAGALHLVAARAATRAAERVAAAERARAALDKALAIDANLEREYLPLRDEAIRLSR